MKAIKIYLDEDVHTVLASALHMHGYDVMTTVGADRMSSSDADQLEFAISQRRAMLTFNAADFQRLHSKYMKEGKNHYGVIISSQLPVGEALRRILKLLSRLSLEEMQNRLEYLSSWK